MTTDEEKSNDSIMNKEKFKLSACLPVKSAKSVMSRKMDSNDVN